MADMCGNTDLYLTPFFESYYHKPWGNGLCGHGSCVEGLCVCEKGWTGLSDFINTEGITCDINIYVVKALWAFNLAFSAHQFWTSRYRLLNKRKQHHHLVRINLAKGRKYTLIHNKGLCALIMAICVCMPAIWIVGLLRIGTNTERVGHTWAITIFFAIAKIGFSLASYFFQPHLLSTMLKGCRHGDILVNLAKLWGLANATISIIIAILPIVTVAASSNGRDSVAQAVYLTYMSGSLLCMIFHGLQAVFITRRFQKLAELTGSSGKTDRWQHSKRRVYRLQQEAWMQSLFQGIVYTLFIFMPFMHNKMDYFIPIGWLAYHILYRKMSKATASSDKNNLEQHISLNSIPTDSTSDMEDQSIASSKSGSTHASLSGRVFTSFLNFKAAYTNPAIQRSGLNTYVPTTSDDRKIVLKETGVKVEGGEHDHDSDDENYV